MTDEKDFNQFTQQVAGSLDQYADLRERRRLNQTPWKDLTIEQKVERMREIIKQLERSHQWHSQRMQDLNSHLAALNEHGHQDGKVMIPILRNQGYGIPGEPQEKKVEGWF